MHYYNSLSINMTFTVDFELFNVGVFEWHEDQAQPFVGTTFTDLLNFSHGAIQSHGNLFQRFLVFGQFI